MRFKRLTLAMTAVISTLSFQAQAIEFYVDTKTKQIFAEPGRGRVPMGNFVREDNMNTKNVPPSTDAGEIAAIREDLELKNNEIKALQEHAEEAQKVKVELGEKGLEIKTKDDNFKMSMGGRMQLDGQVNGGGQGNKLTQTLNDGAGMRRARIHAEGTLYHDYNFKLEYDFVRGNGTTAAGITDASVQYAGIKNFGLTLGQFKEPFSLESVTSNRYLTFLERSYANNAFVEFANPYLLGLSMESYGQLWTARGALQAEPIGGGGYNAETSLNAQGNANRNGQSGNPTYGGTGRVTFLPYFGGKDKIFHMGASGSYRVVNNTNGGAATAAGNPTGMAFASQVSDVDRSNWANTGVLTDLAGTKNRRVLDSYYRLGGELMGIYGPFSFQAEYMMTQLQGQNYDSTDTLYGYYGLLSYFITGESRVYDTKNGKINRQKANKNFSLANGGWGAWKLPPVLTG